MTEKTVFMFPGQGSQYVGMQEKLLSYDAGLISVFDETDEILGFELSNIIKNGPEEELTKTSNTQPALLATGIAFSRAMEKLGYSADLVMGHSLGEYTALVYSGVLSFKDGIELVRKRGQLMEKAVENISGGMAAVVGADIDALTEIVKKCGDKGIIEITNFNSPVQVVLSGETVPVDEAVRIINDESIGKAIKLNVSAPFHSSLMKPVADKFKEYISDVEFNKTGLTFINNVTGEIESDPGKIRENLIHQLYMPVLWEKSIHSSIRSEAGTLIECGPGKTLSGLAKKTSRDVKIITGQRLLK